MTRGDLIFASALASWTAVGAVGSAVAALIAIYLGAVQGWWRRPKLKVHKPRKDRELIIVPATLDTTKTQDSAWVRFRVSAANRKEAAEDVEVMILRVSEVEPREGSSLPTSSGPALAGLSLRWTDTDIARTHIPAGAERIFNLAAVFRSQTTDESGPLVIQTASRVPLDGGKVFSLTTDVELAVTARNAGARKYRVQVRFDGKWGSATNDIWQHLKVEDLTQL